MKSGAFKGRVIDLGVKDDVVRLELNDALKAKIPSAAIAASDSVGAQLKAGTFTALRDLLAGSDSAKPIKQD